MSTPLGRMIVEDFLKISKKFIEALVKKTSNFETAKTSINLYFMKDDQKKMVTANKGHFFLRGSVEYSNPQLTVEELQGVIAVRLLEVCGNYFEENDVFNLRKKDVDEICEQLVKPLLGKVFAFLLNTDDIEPDRYSMNPFKESIVETGQSAFPVASVKTDELVIDKKFLEKYEGALITEEEVELIERYLSHGNYMDMVDSVKYEQLKRLSDSFGMDLCLPAIRMPLTVLEHEQNNDLLHYIIKESHKNYVAIEQIYQCMGRSIKKRRTLLVFPHSRKGYASKRAARGKMYFTKTELTSVRIIYKTTALYPNAIDPKDISVAKADDKFMVDGKNLIDYDYRETPVSPQFILYSLASPENATLWHGIGAFGASKLVKSYTSTRFYAQNILFKDLWQKHGVRINTPLQYNLIPEKMWTHPVYDNIDASVGCVKDLEKLAKRGISLELLTTDKYLRNLIS